ncbi:helix-turn-helix domain-containing protein [Planctomicrobium piriforme]|uniref:DNA binding domain-containing protein, excisionase family n=1 Tax=Planctomicrobium piriforme TaxID=1576369 RepID=A0A1I3EQ99_9PLAN|nr:helix-turn-helix domain-containing protein [Planctomicrobium piriforme]SFI01176.1 DNA binding domain-containing protein, excisionase family [Planctomicrobium piriforme]
MTKKYLSLDEAARILGIPQDELVRLREKGDIRGFADRGTWKFKQDDVESLGRRRQADSSPEVPLYDPEKEARRGDLGEQPTVIRRDKPNGNDNLLAGDDARSSMDSDSDVRLVGGPDLDLGFGADSDSDVKLMGIEATGIDNLGTDPELPIFKSGSDSDVKLVRPDSDSDVKLAGDNSDSDVQLIGGETEREITMKPAASKAAGKTDSDLTLQKKRNSDSDVRLVGNDSGPVGDVTFLDDDDAVAIDFDPDRSRQASVLDDESGISLGGDSSLLLGESGISLAGPNDSGIALDLNDDDEGLTLALDDESGISLDAGESGISLESAESGISLENAESGISLDDSHGTMPMMDIMGGDDDDQTNFEIPSLNDDDRDSSDADVTGVMDIHGSSDDVFTLDEEAEGEADAFDEDMDLEAESMEEEQDLDVFDAGEGTFEGSETEGYASSSVGRMPQAETEWGTATFVGLTVASLLLLLCGAVMIDLVKHTATASQMNPVSGKMVEIFGGLHK